MREAIGSLTTRGRAFAAAGLAAAACALVLGQDDLLRVGVLLLALPMVAAYSVGRTRYKLASGRRIEPARVESGQAARVVLRLDNVSRLPSGLLLLEDEVPRPLGPSARFALDRVEARGHREIAYPLRTARRGRYTVGPLSLRLHDPFGLVELTRSFSAVTSVTVTPRVELLPSVPLGGEWAGSGESRARSLASAGEDDVTPREYRLGDDLRRVDWRATAKLGELMVRREEQPWESRALVLLDNRSAAHGAPFTDPAGTFERAVSAAASVGVHFAHAGYTIDLLTAVGQSVVAEGSPVGDQKGVLLDALAVVETALVARLSGLAPVLRHLTGDGLIVAVLGRLDADEAAELARMRRSGGAAIAVLVQRGPVPTATDDAAAAVLAGQGWRVLRLGPDDTLAGQWPLVSRVAMGAGAR